ncbi:unnamed protein product [Camellia sinensis]
MILVFLIDFSWQENTESLSDKEKTLLSLAKMGYTVEEASIAMDRCGPDASIDEITDFLCAAQMAKAADYLLPDDDKFFIFYFNFLYFFPIMKHQVFN